MAWLKRQGWLTGAVFVFVFIAILAEFFLVFPGGGAGYWPIGLLGVIVTIGAAVTHRKWWLLIFVPVILWPMAMAMIWGIYLLFGGEIGSIGF